MKNIFLAAIIFLIVNLTLTDKIHAQGSELIGGNLLNGAILGSSLAIATMGLNNDWNSRTFQIGLGAGILAGTGLAIYDVATLPQGQQFFISGVFNDGRNSSIIILLDTAYGAALGSAVGAAFSLIGNTSFVKGIQYGASAGAWTGFGFGLIDCFGIAERNRDFMSDLFNRNAIFEYNSKSMSIHFLEPGLFAYHNLSGNTLSIDVEPALNIVSLKKSF
ncbi:MAG: hypothetical protein EA359_15865 [Balneolaceae bacterium]|nr:MAG: hypothetical protein EA359_15865 [Balneolaceae bacterium]